MELRGKDTIGMFGLKQMAEIGPNIPTQIT